MLPSVFSRQTEFSLEPNPLFQRRAELEAAGLVVLDLTGSNPTAVSLDFADDWPQTLARAEVRRYDPVPFGTLPARRVLADRWRRLGQPVAKERIVLSSSTSEAYSHLFKLLCNPGDEVLVPQPSYPLFEHLARLEHVTLSGYRLGYDGHWYVDLDSLQAARGPRTRAVIVVSPNNPTGSILREAELSALGELGLPIISDEVFSRFLFGAAATRFRTALSVDGCLVFVLDGLSKSLGLPQCKLAWTSVAGPRPLVEAALSRLEIVTDAYLSVSTSIQCALPELLALESERQRVIQQRLERNLDELQRRVKGSAATLLSLDGGWSAVLQLPSTRSESEWVLTLLERDGIWVQPGWFFDFEREAFVVVSLLTPCGDFATGVERLIRRVNAE